ncbi:MAG TPA: hypothetical protein VLN90_06345, partial [Thioalkalivibrio sp.]|nr:hypothetical protein [Thioalkalivibrio sp.]
MGLKTKIRTCARRSTVALITGLSLSVTPSQAETLAQLSEHDFFADLPVVLTATRLQQPVADAPAAVTVIDRELI